MKLIFLIIFFCVVNNSNISTKGVTKDTFIQTNYICEFDNDKDMVTPMQLINLLIKTDKINDNANNLFLYQTGQNILAYKFTNKQITYTILYSIDEYVMYVHEIGIHFYSQTNPYIMLNSLNTPSRGIVSIYHTFIYIIFKAK